MQMRIAVISDHLGTTTGFKVATQPFVDGFLKEGWKVFYLGLAGAGLDWPEDHPVKMTGVDGGSPQGDILMSWLTDVQPDIVLAVRDPGTMAQWAVGPSSIAGVWSMIKDGHLNQPLFKVVLYTPIEGLPISRAFQISFEVPFYTGGQTVFWTPTAMKLVQKQFPTLADKCDFVYFGLDHFPENDYSPEDRDLLKEMAGMSDRMVITTVGTNKRTKGLAEAIYTAHEYKKRYGSGEVIFYIHTEPEDPIVGGHDLIHLRHQYGVEDIVVFKPSRNLTMRKNSLSGVERDGSGELLSQLRKLKDIGFTPMEPEEALSNLRNYRLTDIFAMSDLYLDLSTLEGWGLPVGEAQRWGLPVMGVEDRAVRDEIYSWSRIIIPSEDSELWDTWNSGARLVKVRPSTVAGMIKSVYEDRPKLDEAIEAGKKNSSLYKWSPSVEKMIEIIRRCHGDSQDLQLPDLQ
jgi:hypothetical protein